MGIIIHVHNMQVLCILPSICLSLVLYACIYYMPVYLYSRVLFIYEQERNKYLLSQACIIIYFPMCVLFSLAL